MKARGFINTDSTISFKASHLASSVMAKRKQQVTLYAVFETENPSKSNVNTTVHLQPVSGEPESLPA